jgi:hypothetical protein
MSEVSKPPAAEDPKLEIITTINRLRQVIQTSGRAAIYFYLPNWQELNKNLNVDVCEAFADGRKVDTHETAFFEADISVLSKDTNFYRFFSTNLIPTNIPCVMIFENGIMISQFTGQDLAHITKAFVPTKI